MYDTKDGYFYQKSNKHIVAIIVLTVFLFFSGALSVYSSVKSNQLRTANDRLTEQLNRTTDTCTRLTETIGECQSICRQLDESSRRDISDIRTAIEIIEETREAVGAMEVALGLFDSDGYYTWLDNYLRSDEVKE